ncbi:hypothetical protein HELRODRAFT_162992 [Helobdella robusta]|uniref:Uncharacterized protein n=1 Tax=Helobdella robusta TaxID=6412 RepID=T1ETI4_HELRO|nr:hypothetical protein HELRODRAFT_162992 [Helobdella robusta]ESN99443.1 hypothetical protein HELRODRAFT_162992 [Helobdella robusta]
MDTSHLNVKLAKSKNQIKAIQKKWSEICKNKSHNTHQCRKNKNSAKSVLDNQQEEKQSYLFFKASESQSIGCNNRLVDCGLTTHIVTDKSKFVHQGTNFKSTSRCIELEDGSGSTGIVKGRGTAKVAIHSSDGKTRDVYLENTLRYLKIFFWFKQQQKKELQLISTPIMHNSKITLLKYDRQKT